MLARKERDLARRRKLVEAQIEAMRAELTGEIEEVESAAVEERAAVERVREHRVQMRQSSADATAASPARRRKEARA
jgi:hypothetical protein